MSLGPVPLQLIAAGQPTPALIQFLNDLKAEALAASAAAATASTAAAAAAAKTGFTLQAAAGVSNPVDSTTVFWGSLPSAAPGVATVYKVFIPRACTLAAVYLHCVVAGTLGTTENTAASFRLNNTTDVSISAALKHDAIVQSVSATGLTQACAAGDYFEIKLVYPVFATNPTNVFYAAVCRFSPT